MSNIDRVQQLDKDTFVASYLCENRPVIVTDCMEQWPAKHLWNPEYFVRKFGDYKAQVYDDLFDFLDTSPISEYISKNFSRPAHFKAHEYIRWYVQFKDLDFPFPWADEIFNRLEGEWSTPNFFPTTDFILPYSAAGAPTLAHRHVFPYKGLFISGRGARTRLHRDPFGTDAVLCQFFGSKRMRLYRPQDQDKLCRGSSFFDPSRPDPARFPKASEAKPVFVDVLSPGETVFIPSGWFHDVSTETDSISITWNFVHGRRSEPFLQAIRDPNNSFDHDMIAYFFAQAGQPISELGDVEIALSRLFARERSVAVQHTQ